MWLSMTENILLDCSSRCSVKQIDKLLRETDAMSSKNWLTMLRCCFHHKDSSLSFWNRKATSKYTLGNIGWCLGGMKQRYDTRRAEKKWPFIKPLVKYLSFADCGSIFDYVMLLLVFQWWYDGDHGYWVGYIYIFKYETNFCLMKTTYCLTS